MRRRFRFLLVHPELSNVINPPNGVTRNVAVPSVDFKCALTIYAKSRSIIAVMLNNSFIRLATRRTVKTTRPSDEETATANTAAATAETTAASGKRVATTTTVRFGLVQVSN